MPDAARCAVPDVAWQRYGQIDQASYDFVDDVMLPITDAIVERAATQLDRKLAVRTTRLLRLRAATTCSRITIAFTTTTRSS